MQYIFYCKISLKVLGKVVRNKVVSVETGNYSKIVNYNISSTT